MDQLLTLATLLSLTFFVVSTAAFIFVIMLPKPDNKRKASSSIFFHLFVVFINVAFCGFLFRFFITSEFPIFVNHLFLVFAALAFMESIFRRYEITSSPIFLRWLFVGLILLVCVELLLYLQGGALFYRELILYCFVLIPIGSAIKQLNNQISKQRVKEKTIFYTTLSFTLIFGCFIVIYATKILEGDIAYIGFYFLSCLVLMISAFIGFTLSIIYSLLGKLRQQAFTDKLTGAANRDQFYNSINRVMARMKRHSTNCALIICDIDHFKQVNDTYGHVAGDMLLKSFVELIEKELRTEDVLYRIGGEEFIIVCQEATGKDAFLLAERLRGKLAELVIPYNDDNLKVTASFGISEINTALTIEQNIHAADKRLYQSKQKGRNKTTFV